MAVWDDEKFMARRGAARERIAKQLGLGEQPNERNTWFDSVYELADGDAAGVPWADLKPKDSLTSWLESQPASNRSGRAIDVACGLGDNAEAIARAGFDVTAFDFSKKAIAWARERFPDTSVDYVVADLLNPPAEWLGAFDFVHETYTIQALRDEMRAAALSSIAKLLAPGGRLLVICRARDNGEAVEGPPWPLDPMELAAFGDNGLEEIRFEDYLETRDRPIRHFRVEYRRPSG
ncbi:MAG: class I SAM-dependent methyltransferase [Fimbriimonadaceae bacterium]|nr:class I SAM-dependent methyltransferase [Alphaproteobacteria bacterium]